MDYKESSSSVSSEAPVFLAVFSLLLATFGTIDILFLRSPGKGIIVFESLLVGCAISIFFVRWAFFAVRRGRILLEDKVDGICLLFLSFIAISLPVSIIQDHGLIYTLGDAFYYLAPPLLVLTARRFIRTRIDIRLSSILIAIILSIVLLLKVAIIVVKGPSAVVPPVFTLPAILLFSLSTIKALSTKHRYTASLILLIWFGVTFVSLKRTAWVGALSLIAIWTIIDWRRLKAATYELRKIGSILLVVTVTLIGTNLLRIQGILDQAIYEITSLSLNESSNWSLESKIIEGILIVEKHLEEGSLINWLFGFGFGSTYWVPKQLTMYFAGRIDVQGQSMHTVHAAFLDSLLRIGLFGTVLYIGFIIIVGLYLLRSLRTVETTVEEMILKSSFTTLAVITLVSQSSKMQFLSISAWGLITTGLAVAFKNNNGRRKMT